MREIHDKKARDEYRDLCMMRDRLAGHTFKEIGAAWGCTERTASAHVRKMASECMRQAMTETRGDPEHPAPGSFTVEKFTADPRACMTEIMERWIAAIEERWPEVQ